MSSRSTRTKAKKKAFVKAHKTSAKQRAAANTVIRSMRAAKLRPGASGVYRALLNPRVQGFLGLEKKFYDTARVHVAIAGNPDCTGGVYNPLISGQPGSLTATNCMSVPGQGVGPQQRMGKSITIKSVQIKGMVEIDAVTFPTATPPNGHSVFVALVLDTQTNGAQCTSESIFQNLSNSVYSLCVPTRNLLNAKRFKILKSETFNLDAKTLTLNAIPTSMFAGVGATVDWYLPLELPVNFIEQTDEDIANVVDNSLHLIAFYNQTNLTARITYNARIRFLG